MDQAHKAPEQTPAQDGEKKPFDIKNLNMETLKVFLGTLKQYLLILKKFFINKEHEKTIVLSATVLSLLGLLYSGFSLTSQLSALNKETPDLHKLNKYSIDSIKNNQVTAGLLVNAETIKDLLSINKDLKEEIQRYDSHKKELQSSYSNFLQYFLVPNLNVRKEPYTNKIDVDLMGENFLENNPFNEINLFQKRSNVFSNIQKNQINNIESLEIGEIKETDFGLYSIPISFKFSAPSKNTLLSLADKISITSDKENIALLGEFVYYLRQQIKLDKKDLIEKLKSDENYKVLANNEDQIIGRNLYLWITKDQSSQLIDQSIINKTVSSLMECGSDSEVLCFYKFRDKYRNISELAYTIGATSNSNKTNDLKSFFKNMSPLISITTFNFDKSIDKESITKALSYNGRVSLEIYGQNIRPDEIQQIGLELGKKCFAKNEELSPTLALSKVNEIDPNQIAQEKTASSDFTDGGKADLISILETISASYETSNNYKKTIRLFEIYRILDEAGYCTAI